MVKTPLIVMSCPSQQSKEQINGDIAEIGQYSKIFQNNVGASHKSSMNHITAQQMEVNALVKVVMSSMVSNSLQITLPSLQISKRLKLSPWLLLQPTKLTMLLVIHLALRVLTQCLVSKKNATVMIRKTLILRRSNRSLNTGEALQPRKLQGKLRLKLMQKLRQLKLLRKPSKQDLRLN